MEFANRRLLLLNEDVPVPVSMPPLSHTHTKHATNTSSSLSSSSSSSSSSPQSSTLGSPLEVSIRPVFASNVAYVFLILFTTFFFIGFVFLYFRQFNSDNSSSFRRRAPAGRVEGSAAAAAKAMPVVSYSGEAECAICLEEFNEGEEVKVIPYCKHVFHPECIDTWLDKHVTCPVCRCSKLCENEEVGSVSERREEEEEEEEEVVVPNLD